MKFKEALDKRIPRIRQARWAVREAYLLLPLLPNEKVGPWVKLYEDQTQLIIGIAPGSQSVPVYTLVITDDEFEEYTGPISTYEDQATPSPLGTELWKG